MPFPEAPRVIYKKNPLMQVVCQLHYPPILRINHGDPIEFQEGVRERFPFYNRQTQQIQVQGVPEEAPQIAKERYLTSAVVLTHQFTSEDKNWLLTLTAESMSLTCQNYQRWEEFRSYLTGPYKCLMDRYKPLFFNRIGLRYQDLIQPSKLELQGAPWTDLLHPQVAGLLSDPQLSSEVEGIQNQCLINLGDGARVILRTSLVQDQGTQEVCFLIDSDFYYDQRVECDDTFEKLVILHRGAGRLFRWCILDALHAALEPEPA